MSSLVPPIFLLVSATAFLVAAAVYLRSEKEPDALQRRFLVRFYVYGMLFVSLVIIFAGGGTLLRASLSYPFGMTFSYRGQIIVPTTLPTPREPPEPPKVERVEYREEERQRDLASGGAYTVVGLASLALHWALRRRVESPAEEEASFLRKGYLMISAVVFGVMAIVTAPLALYQLVIYAIMPSPPPETIWQREPPGDVLGFALLATAIWLWLLPQVLHAIAPEGS